MEYSRQLSLMVRIKEDWIILSVVKIMAEIKVLVWEFGKIRFFQ